MAEIPVSNKDLDNVIYQVARDILEQGAIDGTIDDMSEETIRQVTQNVIFTVERYMHYINELITQSQQEKIDLAPPAPPSKII